MSLVDGIRVFCASGTSSKVSAKCLPARLSGEWLVDILIPLNLDPLAPAPSPWRLDPLPLSRDRNHLLSAERLEWFYCLFGDLCCDLRAELRPTLPLFGDEDFCPLSLASSSSFLLSAL